MKMNKNELVKKINTLKKQKNAIILAHCYQNIEIDFVADYVGDSLYLSQKAAEADADVIIFAGVYFMAETAKILSPQKKVLLPKLEAGCYMADMINLEQIKAFKAENPDLPVVCYVNSTAEVKAESDICCTSSNAVNVVKSLGAKKVLFVPDTYLGTFVENQLDGVEVVSYPGYCKIHQNIQPEDVMEKKKLYPKAEVLVHPECHYDVTKLADYVGSTTGIMQRARESAANSFIICTEKGVVDRLQRDLSEKEFVLVSEKALCDTMKMIYLEDVLNSLENEQFEITVDPEISKRAVGAIDKMIKISG